MAEHKAKHDRGRIVLPRVVIPRSRLATRSHCLTRHCPFCGLILVQAWKNGKRVATCICRDPMLLWQPTGKRTVERPPLNEEGQLEDQSLHHGSTCPIDGNAHISTAPHYNKRASLGQFTNLKPFCRPHEGLCLANQGKGTWVMFAILIRQCGI